MLSVTPQAPGQGGGSGDSDRVIPTMATATSAMGTVIVSLLPLPSIGTVIVSPPPASTRTGKGTGTEVLFPLATTSNPPSHTFPWAPLASSPGVSTAVGAVGLLGVYGVLWVS